MSRILKAWQDTDHCLLGAAPVVSSVPGPMKPKAQNCSSGDIFPTKTRNFSWKMNRAASSCLSCILAGYCRRRRALLITDDQIRNGEFIRDVRGFAYGLGIKADHWHEFLTNLYRDYPGWVRGTDGGEVFLDMEEFERPNIGDWFGDFCCTPCPPDVIPRVRCEARERVRVLATILRARFPQEAQFWGLRGDNDNEPNH